MMKSRIVIILGILVLGALTIHAQQPDAAKQQQEMMKEMEMMQPGPEHQRLADMAGKWDVEIKLWSSPDAPPVVANATANDDLILGGRFLQIHSTGQLMGMLVESIIIMGFDRRKGEYTWVGFDSFGTYYITAAGKYDEATNTITMSGIDEDPARGLKQTFEVVVNIADRDTHVFKVIFKDHPTPKGKIDFVAAQITSKRQK